MPLLADWRTILAILIGALLCAVLVRHAPLLGHDWMAYFARDPAWVSYFSREDIQIDAQYPPWIWLALKPLVGLPSRTGLAMLHGLTISAVAVLTYHYGRRTYPHTRIPAILGLILVLINPILWMLLWLGQIEGVALLGVASLPFGIPLLFAKPNIALWSAFRWRWHLVAILILFLVSFLVWPNWLPEFIAANMTNRVPYRLSMGWAKIGPWIGIIGAVLFLLTDRDPMRLMAAGSLMSPFMMPYHYYQLLPALGRTRGYAQIGLWASSLLMLAVTAFESTLVKYMALSMPLLVWLLLARSLNPRDILADPDILLNRMLRTARRAWQMLDRRVQRPPVAPSGEH